jgi:hypothetical protein
VFKDKVMMRIYRSKWEEVRGGWKKLHKELHNFSLLDTRLIKSWKKTGAWSIHARKQTCIQNFARKHEGKRPQGRCKYRWKNNIKMNLKNTGWEGMDWIHLTQNELHNKNSSLKMLGN